MKKLVFGGQIHAPQGTDGERLASGLTSASASTGRCLRAAMLLLDQPSRWRWRGFVNLPILMRRVNGLACNGFKWIIISASKTPAGSRIPWESRPARNLNREWGTSSVTRGSLGVLLGHLWICVSFARHKGRGCPVAPIFLEAVTWIDKMQNDGRLRESRRPSARAVVR